MGARRGGIHVGAADGSILSPIFHLLVDFLVAGNGHFNDALNKHADLGRHAYVETLFWALVRGHKQVLDLFIVDLEHRYCNLVVDVVFRVFFSLPNASKDLVASSRHDTRVAWIAGNRVGLARARLPIGEHAHVVACEGVVNEWDAVIVENQVLIGIGTTRIRL